MKTKFYKDLEEVYSLVKKKQESLHRFYDVLKEKDSSNESEIIDSFLRKIGLEITSENRLCVITRLVSLRDDSLIQVLKKTGFNEEEIIKKKEDAYLWVADYHLKMHQELIDEIESKELLTPFYREIFKGVHEVGKVFSGWQSSWTAHIIDGVNRELYRLFNGDEEKIFEMLHEKELFDKGHDGGKGDRSYSVLVEQEDGSFRSVPYAEAFTEEVTAALLALAAFKNRLLELEDEVFDQKEAHVDYLQAIIEALAEKDSAKLIPKWADVDRKWMKVTAPLQIGHPLEYYEDHYKKAVALEWDLRIVNPENSAGDVKEKIVSMYSTIFENIQHEVLESQKIYEGSLNALHKVQLYLGRPALYYGAEFCGLFSAQVVPNDEVVTKEAGKKIFAFADNVLESIRAKPFMQIQKEVFPESFLYQSREIIFKKPEIWYEIYNITTIGHEYGHILWIDNDTETVMNSTGNFKNIEEFKATTGGLSAFFMDDNPKFRTHILNDTIKRAVGLIAWKETGEVEPYYCEGLIHLSGLFETGVLKFGKKLEIDTSEDAYERIKSWYLDTYKSLARHYLQKEDASTFLYRYAQKEGKYFMPVGEEIKYFVNYYWNLHTEIGQVLDRESSKEEWL
jgi:hypothetical protein